MSLKSSGRWPQVSQLGQCQPKRLLNQIGKKYDQYLEYGQQDGHELMRHLLDACRMEELDVIKKMRPPPPKKKAKTDQSSIASSSRTSASASLTPADMENGQIVSNAPASVASAASQTSLMQAEENLLPFLDLLFCGKLASMVVCEGCKKVSHTYEDFYDISLSLREDVNNPKSRKRDRLRSMADRWRKATQGRTIMDRKAAAAATAAGATPVGTPRYSETDASDADSSTTQLKKSTSFLSPDEGGRGRFALRTRSLRKSGGRHEKLGATSGSEMEPDFPDMASLSLAPTGATRAYVDSAPPSAGEDNGDARTGTRVARMLGSVGTADASSRETSPNPPMGDRSAAAPFAAGMRPPLRAAKSSSHHSAYIARIMADDPASTANPTVPRKAGAPSPLFDAVAAVASTQGKPVNGFFRSAGPGARTRDPCADFEPDPKSQGAKRRQKIREEQAPTVSSRLSVSSPASKCSMATTALHARTAGGWPTRPMLRKGSKFVEGVDAEVSLRVKRMTKKAASPVARTASQTERRRSALRHKQRLMIQSSATAVAMARE